MYRAISDVARYPEFVPGWRRAQVTPQADGTLSVTQEIGLGPVNARFVSTAELDPPTGLQITARDGPFRSLCIRWQVAESGPDRSRVALEIRAQARGLITAPFIEANLERAGRRLIDLFAQRARDLSR